ncbi:type II secretion system F family protein [Desulfofalx alkaliphila]|uniref:type II secretion system F family protein n=1 Tax=Desulfofalx alkaliphila TaxID=105483 RepID=UPI0004E1B196|nr:hypothetical protein [Desulfofalx alkaliphila]
MLQLVALCLGLLLVGTVIVYIIITLLVEFLKQQKQKQVLSPHISHWMSRVDKYLKLRNSTMKASVYVLLISFAITTGLFTGAAMNNPLAAVLLTIIAFVIPEQIFHYIALRRKLFKFDQLVEACPVFASELERVKVAHALGNTGRSIPDPVGKIFRQAERDLTSRDPQEAFGRMVKELDFNYGRDFVSRAHDCYYNSAVAPMFLELGKEMESKRKRLHEKISQLFQDRIISILTLLLFFPAYAIAASVVPTTWEFMTQTVGGKLLICLYLLSVGIGPMLDYTTIRRMEV